MTAKEQLKQLGFTQTHARVKAWRPKLSEVEIEVTYKPLTDEARAIAKSRGATLGGTVTRDKSKGGGGITKADLELAAVETLRLLDDDE